MARSRTLILAAAVLALGGGGAWWYFNRTPPTPLDLLRAKVKANPADAATRVELVSLLMDTAEKDAAAATKDDGQLLKRTDLSPQQHDEQFKKIKARRAAVAELNREAGEVITAGLANGTQNLKLVQLGVRHFKHLGNWAQVKEIIDKARAAGGPPEAHTDRGICEGMIVACYFLHQMYEGNEEATKLLAADKENTLAILALARVSQLRRDLTAVDRTLDEIARRGNPADPFALAIYGALLRDRNRPESALDAFTRATLILPDLADFHYLLAAMHRRMGNEPGAVLQYELIRRVNEKDPYVYVGLAETFHNQGDNVKASDRLREAAWLAPNDPAILQRYAKFLSESNDEKTLAHARFYAERAAKASNDQDFEALMLLAHICAKARRFDDAQDQAKKALTAAERVGARGAITEIREDITHFRNMELRTPRREDLGPDTPPADTAPGTLPAADPATAPAAVPASLPSTQP